MAIQPNLTTCTKCISLPFGGKQCFQIPCFDGLVGVEIDVDDDSGSGNNAKIVYTATADADLRVAVRSSDADQAGVCDLLLDGALWREDAEFGGVFVNVGNIRSGETIDTVRVPNGSGPDHVAYLLQDDQLGFRRRVDGDGVAGGVSWTLDEPGVVVFGLRQSSTPGDVRIVRNDAALSGHDLDDDGLGEELEDALGLCSALSGTVHGRIPDWRLDILEARYTRVCESQTSNSTDRDECIADYFAYLDQRLTTSFDCDLAVDARDTDGDGLSDRDEVLGRTGTGDGQALPLWGADPRHKDMFVEVDFMIRDPEEEALRMQPHTARQFASYYQDDVGIFNNSRRSAHAESLVNPDDLPGIHVHMDTGVEPEVPEDAANYGDWGGHNAVLSVLDDDGNWTGVKFTTAWKDHMSPARYGLFRYQLPYASGGGSNPINHIASSGGLNSAWVLAHEAGHANGIHHYGPNHSEKVGVNCKPNYVSLMNYAYSYGVGFSDGLNVLPLNNSELTEWEAVPVTSTAYLQKLKSTYRYWVDEENGHVDWNRDGEFAPPGTTVKAQANFRPYGSCEGTRTNAQRVPDAASHVSPALDRLANRTYVFYSVLGLLRYQSSSSSWDCPEPLGEGQACGTWYVSGNAPINAFRGVDVARLGPTRDAELLVVRNNSKGELFEARLFIDSRGRETWTDAVRIPGTNEAVGEPALVRMTACLAYLAYKDTSGRIRLKTYTHDSGWGADEIATTPDGEELTMWRHASPGLGRAYLAWKLNAAALYGAFADEDGRLALYGYKPLRAPVGGRRRARVRRAEGRRASDPGLGARLKRCRPAGSPLSGLRAEGPGRGPHFPPGAPHPDASPVLREGDGALRRDDHQRREGRAHGRLRQRLALWLWHRLPVRAWRRHQPPCGVRVGE